VEAGPASERGLIASRVAKTLTRLRRQRNIHHMMTSSGDEFFGFGAMTVLYVDQQPQIGKDPR
jgi:hypothetical protein